MASSAIASVIEISRGSWVPHFCRVLCGRSGDFPTGRTPSYARPGAALRPASLPAAASADRASAASSRCAAPAWPDNGFPVLQTGLCCRWDASGHWRGRCAPAIQQSGFPAPESVLSNFRRVARQGFVLGVPGGRITGLQTEDGTVVRYPDSLFVARPTPASSAPLDFLRGCPKSRPPADLYL